MEQLAQNVQEERRPAWRGGLLLIGLTWIFCYLYCFRQGVFGAKVDWISQHSVLPDYFRQQFYETGELFPEFAANIGGGQNIYHFSYYGLYNPLLLPAYLLPSVKMSDYMMAVQFLCLAASVLLMYCWLKKKGFSEEISIGVSVMFLLSAPMIYHSCKQIMFVDYMPFLIAGLIEVDRYFEKKVRRYSQPGLTLSIFLMIMTSFYFSIGGMLVLTLYGIHCWLAVGDEREEKRTARNFFAEGLRFGNHFITAVMLSGILLVPTALALTRGNGKGAAFHPEELLLPKMSVIRFCYSPYGIGMTVLVIIALIALLFGRKWSQRALAIGCMTVLTVPLFAYMLNGGLYVRDKAMIPFLPLLCYVLACYLDGLEHAAAKKRGDVPFISGLFPYALTAGLICVNQRQGNTGEYGQLLMLDCVVMVMSYLLSLFCQQRVIKNSIEVRKRKRYHSCMTWLLLAPALLMLTVSDYHIHENITLDREFYREATNSEIGELMKKALDGEEGWYRAEQLGNDDENKANLNRIWDGKQCISSLYSSSYHEGYWRFRKETFQLEETFRNFLMQSAVYNPVYQRFMGVKYVVSRTEIPGYDVLEDAAGQTENGDHWKVYENERVSPVAYGTDRVISEGIYGKLEFPYNQLALLKYAVVQDGEGASCSAGDDIYEGVEQVNLHLPEKVDSAKGEKRRIDLPVSQEKGKGERILFLRFQIENQKPSKDVSVRIEGIRNTLTARNDFYYNGNTEFTYAVSLEDGQKTVEIILGKGKYEISDVKAYIGRLPAEEDGEEAARGLYQSAFQVDWEKTKGNRIEGVIEAERPGYFITTIPYDENFEVFADGERVEVKKVNTAFLGFEMGTGKHRISMVYHAPGLPAGKLMSLVGALWFCFWNFFTFSKRDGFPRLAFLQRHFYNECNY